MLLKLIIKNFRSYKDKAEFSFEGLNNNALENNYDDVHLNNGKTVRVLHSAVILGANASGKSNVIWALDSVSYMIKSSRNFDYQKGKGVLPYMPFAFDEVTIYQPSEITVEVVTKGNIYHYYIQYSREWIISEKLSIIDDNDEILVFSVSRDNKGNGKIIQGTGFDSRKINLTSMELLPNHLLLSELGTKPVGDILEVYNELSSMQCEPIGDSINLKRRNDNVADQILFNEGSTLFKRLVKLVRIADLGIKDLKMKQEEAEDDDILQNRFGTKGHSWTVQAMHLGIKKDKKIIEMKVPFDNFESVGTNYLFSLGARVLQVLETGGILVYDEMNLALHPDLLRLLVQMFNNPTSNPKHAQLVFTTHDASIVGDNLMRVDQIWFSEKDNMGASQLFSVQDFEGISILAPVEQWYRAGRFGAKPHLQAIDYIFSEEDENE